MSGAVKVPGVEMLLGGTCYVVPPLNVAAIKQHRQAMSELLADGKPDMELVAKLLHAALARNYPTLALATVEDCVDFGNVVDIIDVVMNVSGLVQKMGELGRRAQAMANPSALTNSSPT